MVDKQVQRLPPRTSGRRDDGHRPARSSVVPLDATQKAGRDDAHGKPQGDDKAEARAKFGELVEHAIAAKLLIGELNQTHLVLLIDMLLLAIGREIAADLGPDASRRRDD